MELRISSCKRGRTVEGSYRINDDDEDDDEDDDA
jgi:hypothetical protein